MAAKRFNVCYPRPYKGPNGEEKTHFWQVGKMFPMREQEGFTLQLYTRVLPGDKLVLFPEDSQESAPTRDAPLPPGDDDIPF